MTPSHMGSGGPAHTDLVLDLPSAPRLPSPPIWMLTMLRIAAEQVLESLHACYGLFMIQGSMTYATHCILYMCRKSLHLLAIERTWCW